MRKRSAKKMKMSLLIRGKEFKHSKTTLNSLKMSKMTMWHQSAKYLLGKAKRKAARITSATCKGLRRKTCLILLIFTETFSVITLE